MITVYGLQSPYVYRVRACLLQKELPFQHMSVNMVNRSDAFKKLSPVGTIPVLKDEDGTVICDSVHIALYLDEKYPHSYKMLGKDLKNNVKIFNILGLIDRIHQINHPISMEKYNLFERFRKEGKTHRAIQYDAGQKEDAKKDMITRLDIAKRLLNNQNFFTGEFSFADAAMISLINSLQSAEHEIGFWGEWKENRMKDEKIAAMITSKDELGVGEI